MDPVQLTIITISFILTVLLVVLGVQVFLILKEMRASLQKVNKMLDDAAKMTSTVAESMSGIAGLVSGLKAGLSLFSRFRKRGGDNNE